MWADFIVTVEPEAEGEKRHQVQIKIHESIESLRSACTRYDNKWRKLGRRKPVYGEFDHVLGICHRFYQQGSDLRSIVRLAPPHLGIGILSHELTHAAVHIWEIEHQFDQTPLTCENDERFAWILGELVRQAVDKMYDHGIYGGQS